jgi:beta-glucosidase
MVWGEPNGDRTTLGLEKKDVELIQAVASANPRVVIIVLSGSTVIMPWRDQVPAILMPWFGGMEAGNAIGGTLTGKTEPGGRLPLVIPEDEKDLGVFDPRAERVEYGRSWGQRLLDEGGKVVAWPLGFGLGYTTFEVTDILGVRVDGMKGAVQVRVKNVGARNGVTIVQVYAVTEDRVRPRRELLGFKRVVLPVGQEQDVDLELDLTPVYEDRERTGCRGHEGQL